MEETKKTLCPSCGEEMQEFRGKYFCLACGNEYEEKVDDLGEKNIVLISGNPMKEKTTDSDIPDNGPVDSDIDTDVSENDTEESCNTSGSIVRGIIIGALAGIIALSIIFFAAIMLKSCSDNKENNDDNMVSENVIDKNEEEKQPAVQGDEDKYIEKEDEPTPPPTAQPSATPTAAPTPAPTAKPTETPDTAEQDTLYRVRLTADDAASQLGAFRNLDSAKDLARQNKADGYKVYDQDGKLVYKP